jgi:hypothetical protein
MKVSQLRQVGHSDCEADERFICGLTRTTEYQIRHAANGERGKGASILMVWCLIAIERLDSQGAFDLYYILLNFALGQRGPVPHNH